MIDPNAIRDPRYSPRVVCPSGGVTRLVRYARNNSGHHVLLARTHAALCRALVRLAHAPAYAVRVTEYLEVELVAPPESVCAAIAERMEFDEYDAFVRDIGGTLRESPSSLPPGFTICESYRHEDPDHTTDEWDHEVHNFCANCDGQQVVPPARGWEALFLRLRDAWRQTPGGAESCWSHTRGTRASSARTPRDDEDVWVAGAGAEAHGIEGVKLERVREVAWMRPDSLFFFVPRAVLAHGVLGGVLEREQEALASTQQKRQQRDKDARMRREREARAAVWGLFGVEAPEKEDVGEF